MSITCAGRPGAATCLPRMFMPPVNAISPSTTRILRWLRRFTEKFGGKRADYEKALKAQGFTPAQYRVVHEMSALSTKLFDEITADVKVSDQDVLAYYTQNQANYPESRDVRHILIAVNVDPNCKANCKVDFSASKKKADEPAVEPAEAEAAEPAVAEPAAEAEQPAE